MKLNGVSFCLILGILILAGCSSDTSTNEDTAKKVEEKQETGANNDTAEQENTTTTENDNAVNVTFEGISFHVPANAQRTETVDVGYSDLAFIFDKADQTYVNVLLIPLPEPLTVEEVMESYTSDEEYEYLSIENYHMGDIEWNEMVILNQEGTKVNQRTFVIDNKAYTFSYASSPENYDNHIDAFKAITNSVTLNE